MSDSKANLGDLTIWQKIHLIQEWSPLLTYGQMFLAERDQYKRALVVSDCCEWLASKTGSKADDELVGLIEAVLKSPQGEALVRWSVAKLEGKA